MAAVVEVTGARLVDRTGGGIGAEAGAAVVISGITMDSHAVRPGDLFAAAAGAGRHGADFAADAARSGAVAVLTDTDGADQAAGTGLLTAITPGPVRDVLGAASSLVYGDPTARIDVFGVTGTNGKTTTCYLIDAVISRLGPSGLIGTVQIRIGEHSVPSIRTTPEAPELQALFAVMAENGARRAAMEVSSHALAMGRTDGVRYRVAGFTNLSQDHLDFHHDLAGYFEAKALLFGPERTRAAVIVVDDEAGVRLSERVAATAVALRTVSITRHDTDWYAEEIVGIPDGSGSQFVAAGPDGQRLQLEVGLPGRFNVSNALLAAAMLRETGVAAEQIRAGLAAAIVPGRMERFGNPGTPTVVVDYAHTPDAVEAVLAGVREDAALRRVATVLGCGGDRDPGKRAAMGAAAARYSDLVVITDDNPRSEDPAAIRAAALTGARRQLAAGDPGRQPVLLEISDRRAAIATAIERSAPGDLVLVLGKGHETGQEIAGVTYPFDDRGCVAELVGRQVGQVGQRLQGGHDRQSSQGRQGPR